MINKNIIWVDNLRAISTIAIVLLHVSSQMIYNFGKVDDVKWWAPNLYINISRFGVPIFVMITGLLTLGKPYTLKNFFVKKFSRILIPFLFWSFVYIIYKLLKIYLKNPEQINIHYVITYLYNKLAFGASYQMWYIYMLIGIYLIHPIINKWIIYSSPKEQLYFILICFVAYMLNFYPFNTIKLDIDLKFFSEFLGYLVLGYYLTQRNYQLNVKSYIFICSTIYIFSYLLICLDTYYTSVNNGIYTEQFKPWDLLQTLSVFLLFFLVPLFNKKNKFLSIISKYSYGIYLIHVLIMDLLAKSGLAYFSFNPYFSIPITTLCTMIISILVLYILNQLPLGKYIVK